MVKTVCLALALVAGFLALNRPNRDRVDPERQKFIGTWRVVSCEFNGQTQDVTNAKAVVISGEVFGYLALYWFDGADDTGASYRIDSSKTPKWLDLTNLGGESKGATIRGIYSLKGDKLKLCFSSNGPRPLSVDGGKETNQCLLVLERQRP
jgi:uncharacterized protein (TIGR03067 family)